MESIQSNYCNVSYPSSPIFAFNKNVIKLEDCQYDYYSVRIYRGASMLYEDKRESVNGELSFDISTYVQSIFGRESILDDDTTMTISLQLVCHTSGTETQQVFVYYPKIVWGVITAGYVIQDTCEEVDISENPVVKYLALCGYDVYVRNDLGSFQKIGTNETTHIAELNLASYIGNGSEVILKQVKTSQSTFTDTFDYTFIYRVVDSVSETFKNLQCNGNGIKLKWIDNYGFSHSRIFLRGDYSIASFTFGATIDDFVMQDDTYGFYDINYQQGMIGAQEQILAVPLASREEWNVLKTILTSPCVQYLAEDGNWYQIVVKPATTSRSLSSNLDDFVLTIQLPTISAQRF